MNTLLRFYRVSAMVCLFALAPTAFCRIAPLPLPLAKPGKVIKQWPAKKGNAIKTVVIDAGHGGHDPGCSGAYSKEKNVTLQIALLLADAIRKEHPDVQVVLTRDRDVFIPLHERAAIANRNNADLFISIHCNAMPAGGSATYGSETYVMGLHTAEFNLQVAKRENASILLEENYEQYYDFDPNSPEGHILLSMYQNAYLEQSIDFATHVEEALKTRAQRKSRGVKQAGFMVLKATAMPSVLIETGFLTNPNEENFITNENGQIKIAEAIKHAFAQYKSTLDPYPAAASTPAPVFASNPYPTREANPSIAPATGGNIPFNLNIPPKNRTTDRAGTLPSSSVQFYVQVAAVSNPSGMNNRFSKSPFPIESVQEDKWYKYRTQPFSGVKEASSALEKLKSAGFRDAFIVAYQNGQRISLDIARKMQE
jgi:N-acetylmuramoyl-L-alanine amidase